MSDTILGCDDDIRYDKIVEEISGYMNDSDIPAVIVNGPAGIGKTEICKAVYWKLKSKIPDFSMPFIDLAGLSADDVIPSIAKALEIFREDVSPERIFEIFEIQSPYTFNQRRAYIDSMTKATSDTANCAYIVGL